MSVFINDFLFCFIKHDYYLTNVARYWSVAGHHGCNRNSARWIAWADNKRQGSLLCIAFSAVHYTLVVVTVKSKLACLVHQSMAGQTLVLDTGQTLIWYCWHWLPLVLVCVWKELHCSTHTQTLLTTEVSLLLVLVHGTPGCYIFDKM